MNTWGQDKNVDENNNVGGSIKSSEYSDESMKLVSEQMMAMIVKKIPRVTGVTSMSLNTVK